MAAFFIIGLDVPYAFEPEGWAFPIAYLVVVAVHCVLYLTTPALSARKAILRNVPFNAAAGVLVLIAPHLPEGWGWASRSRPGYGGCTSTATRCGPRVPWSRPANGGARCWPTTSSPVPTSS